MTTYGEQVGALVALLLGPWEGGSRTARIRAFAARTGETPAAFRRRLVLERAAWHLVHTDWSVTDVSLEAGYDSLEGFTRAFGRAYGVSPSLYRRGEHARDLPALSGLHYRPNGVMQREETDMDLQDHLLRFDEAYLHGALVAARTLPESALDAPLGESQPLAFEAPDRTLRALLDKMVFTKEVWVAAVHGHGAPLSAEDRDRTLDGLEARARVAYPAFRAIAAEVRDSERWAAEFTDALCEPAERFPYGGMLAHVVSMDAHRRAVLEAWMRRLGARLSADPMHFRAEVRV